MCGTLPRAAAIALELRRWMQRIAICSEHRAQLTRLSCSVFSKGAFPEVRIETQSICIPYSALRRVFISRRLLFSRPQEPPQQQYQLHHCQWEMIRRLEPFFLPYPASFLMAALPQDRDGVVRCWHQSRPRQNFLTCHNLATGSLSA